MNAAADVAKQFIEFGISEQTALQELLLLLPQIGMGNQAISMGSRLDSPEAQASLSVRLVDCAVIRPNQTPAAMPELRAGAQRVRAALASLDAGEEARSIELLEEIPRGSPWADWRLFVRGWSAFRRGETEQAGANWDRLDPQRSACRIARSLRKTAPAIAGNLDDSADLSLLEVAVFGEPVLARLERLRQSTDPTNTQHFDWKKSLDTLGPLRQSLRRIDPRLAQRLTEILLEPFMDEAVRHPYEAARSLVNDFTRAAEPLPLDPKWNRLWGLLWEQASGSVWSAVDQWKQYVNDLQESMGHDTQQRCRLQALVWRHIGKILADEAGAQSSSRFGYSSSVEARKKICSSALSALEQSLQCDPTQLATHALLVELCDTWQEPEAMAVASRRLLEAFPNDLETLERMLRHHIDREEPEAVLSYVQRIRALKPLSSEHADHEIWAYLVRARQCALAGRWDEGRADFSRATAVSGDPGQDFRGLARQAAFEFKAGEPQRAEAYLQEAGKLLADPVPLALSLSIEAARYELSGGLINRFRQDLHAGLKKKATSLTAGELAKTLLAHHLHGTTYAGQNLHVRQVADFLRRATRIRFCEQDLEHVCGFLQSVPEETLLLDKLARRGSKTFPKSHVFPSILAEREMAKGPFGFNLIHARRHLERALANAEAHDAQCKVIPELRQRLLALKDMDEMMSTIMPGVGKHGPMGLKDILGMLASMMHGDGEDEDDGAFADRPDHQFSSGPAGGNRKRK